MSGDASFTLTLRCPILWDDAHAATLDEPGQLLYRSNLLGADLRVTNFGGGNTSAKVVDEGPADRRAGRSPVGQGLRRRPRLDEARRLRDALPSTSCSASKRAYRGLAHEDEMVALFNHCTFNLNPRAASIDTPLHGFVPHKHVDHVHADAVIAIAACENAEALTQEIFGGKLGFLPWQRPGFDLGLKLGAMARTIRI